MKEKEGVCRKHGEYHSDHGCGVAVNVGSSYADHSMRCDIMQNSMYTPSYADHGFFTGLVSQRKLQNEYYPWEAPAGHCPVCYHLSDSLSKKKKVASQKPI